MRVFKSAWFVRFARREGISNLRLQDAVRRANLGQVDADLGGGVVKQRVVREGQGTSKGYRAIIKRMAKHMLALSDAQVDALIADGRFEEVADYDQAVPE